ncbi:hypothetical protein [Leclercia adecarboxylata]|uniref:hypothetical protein n=1 Tax=Leclercia adecarboxylata TaxID=83655 RepID=UPI003016A3C5
MHGNKKYNFAGKKMRAKELFLHLGIDCKSYGIAFHIYYQRMTNFIENTGRNEQCKTDLSLPKRDIVIRAMTASSLISNRSRRLLEDEDAAIKHASDSDLILKILDKVDVDSYCAIRDEVFSVRDIQFPNGNKLYEYLNDPEIENMKHLKKAKDEKIKIVSRVNKPEDLSDNRRRRI